MVRFFSQRLEDSSGVSTPVALCNVGFQGLFLDESTGNYNNRARIYNPSMSGGQGRFLQRDPLGYPDGMNTYAAYHVMRQWVDPWGLQTIISGGPDEFFENPNWDSFAPNPYDMVNTSRRPRGIQNWTWKPSSTWWSRWWDANIFPVLNRPGGLCKREGHLNKIEITFKYKRTYDKDWSQEIPFKEKNRQWADYFGGPTFPEKNKTKTQIRNRIGVWDKITWKCTCVISGGRETYRWLETGRSEIEAVVNQQKRTWRWKRGKYQTIEEADYISVEEVQDSFLRPGDF